MKETWAPDGNGRSKGNLTLGQMQRPRLPPSILQPNAAAAIGGIPQNIHQEYSDIPTRISKNSNSVISWHSNRNIKFTLLRTYSPTSQPYAPAVFVGIRWALSNLNHS